MKEVYKAALPRYVIKRDDPWDEAPEIIVGAEHTLKEAQERADSMKRSFPECAVIVYDSWEAA